MVTCNYRDTPEYLANCTAAFQNTGSTGYNSTGPGGANCEVVPYVAPSSATPTTPAPTTGGGTGTTPTTGGTTTGGTTSTTGGTGTTTTGTSGTTQYYYDDSIDYVSTDIVTEQERPNRQI
jgi:hypothetical protein